MRRCALLLVVVGAAVGRAEKFSFPEFHAHVLPLLEKYCVGCHSTDEPKGGLNLDALASLNQGGEHGPVVVPGRADQSRLLLSIEGKIKPRMPPKDNPRPNAAEIALLKAWIDGGAKGDTKAAAAPKAVSFPAIAPRRPVRPAVLAVAYAPAGDSIAVASGTQVALIDAEYGVPRQSYGNFDGPITGIAFASDGQTLVAASGEPGVSGAAYRWRLGTSEKPVVLRGHRDSLYSAQLSRDGKLLATAGYDKQIVLWDVATGKATRTLKGHNDAVYDLAFDPSGALLASASGDRTIKLWNTRTGERLDTFDEPTKEQYAVAFHPGGKMLVAAGADNRIRLWRLGPSGAEGTNELIVSRFAHSAPILRLVYTPDGKRLVSSGEDRLVKLWDADLHEIRVFESQPDWAGALAVAPSGAAVAVGRQDGTLALYSLETGQKIRDLMPMSKPPTPVLAGIEPRGITAGTKARVRLTGQHLRFGGELAFSNAKIRGKILDSPPPTETEAWAMIEPAADVVRGTVELTLSNAGGAARRPLVIDDLPTKVEVEPNDGLERALKLAMPSVAWGTIAAPGDADFFALEAAKGQVIVLAISARPLGSKLAASLSLFDSDRRLVASAHRPQDDPEDPVLAHTVERAGIFYVRVANQSLEASTDHFYQLAAGSFAFVHGYWPLSVPPGTASEVELAGYNLAGKDRLMVTPPSAGEIDLPLDPRQYRSRPLPKLLVDAAPQVREREPNDEPAQATPMPVPGVAHGRIHSPSGTIDRDVFRFSAKKGETCIFETDAARRGSPLDTRVEILTSSGQAIERVWLEATRDSTIDFRNINARQNEVRLLNWEEMELNQYLYMRGEVCRFFRMPQGPDSGFQFYNDGGSRRAYFDTTATAHAKGDAVYIVEPRAPGTAIVPNGLPVFRLTYRNDDSGDRRIGSDSRLTFKAPADGEYLVRVDDARGAGGDRYGYRLIARRPAPDFAVRVGPANPAVPSRSGRVITFTADRVDGFEEAITIHAANVPTGFAFSSPLVIEAEHRETEGVLFALPGARAPEKVAWEKVTFSAVAQVTGATVARPIPSLGQIHLGPEPKLTVRLEPAVVKLAPGSTASCDLVVERNGFDDRITFSVGNLPHGVIVDNIGLNGILIPKGQSRRTIYLNARKWVPATKRPFHAVAQIEGNPTSAPIVLEVRPAPQLADAKP